MFVHAVGAGTEPTTFTMVCEQVGLGRGATLRLRKSGNKEGTRIMILPWNRSRRRSSRRRRTSRFPSDIRRRAVDHLRTDISARACLLSLPIVKGMHATFRLEVGVGTRWQSSEEKREMCLRHGRVPRATGGGRC